jgi:formylglycine-generating enzyme required for sulfatase activity
MTTARAIAPVSTFWRVEQMDWVSGVVALQSDESEVAPLDEAGLRPRGVSILATPRSAPLAPWSRLWPLLRRTLQAAAPGREPDVTAIVQAWSRGRVPAQLPGVMRTGWPVRLSIWIDRSMRLAPFWSDQTEVCERLREACGTSAVEVRLLDRQALSQAARRGDLLHGSCVDPETPVLVLGDLGALSAVGGRAGWLRTAHALRRAGVRMTALLPCPPARWDAKVTRAWNAMAWECGRSERVKRSPRFWEERADRLLTLGSAAALLQPGLLRTLRRSLPAGDTDAATEADVWAHRDVRAAGPTGLVLHPEAQKKWRTMFAGLDERVQRRVSTAIERWHSCLPRELLHAETLAWGTFAAPSVPPPGSLEAARAFEARLEATLGGEDTGGVIAGKARHYVEAWLSSMPDGLAGKARWSERQCRLLDMVQGDGVGGSDGPRAWAVRQVGEVLVLEPAASAAWASEPRGVGSPVGMLSAVGRRLVVVRGSEGVVIERVLRAGVEVELDPGHGVELRTDRGALRVGAWKREAWAVAAGRDRYGLWADAEINGVIQRFRWIPPGRFIMGSPEGEKGRYKDEGPRHEVTISAGYWLGDTPVTQGLWDAVMGRGKNPSEFKSPERPVEWVSRQDCQGFMRAIEGVSPGLNARFPTEAEWEYACRAGTETATWVGDLEILGERNAPLLDGIAWYAGNCGSEFELKNGWDISGWKDTQYAHEKGGAHPVKRKRPNPHGLYDMLGNVWEWCEDWKSPYVSTLVPDPRGPAVGSYLIIRGGAWSSDAGVVRAAARNALASGDSGDFLGFRLARGQQGQKPGTEPGPLSGPSRGAGRDRLGKGTRRVQ